MGRRKRKTGRNIKTTMHQEESRVKEEKRPRNQPDDYLDQLVVFSFDRFDLYDWRTDETRQRAGTEAFFRNICGRLKITMQGVTGRKLVGDRRYHHSQPVKKLGQKAQDRIEELGEEVATLVRLRLGGAPRLWGIFEKGIFYMLWWDPDHQVYPTDPTNN